MNKHLCLKTVELLAPARDLETGIAAVDAGADAVYIGGPRFGAREGARNSLADIRALIQYASRYRVRVYAALNTILTDREIPECLLLAAGLHKAGISGFIIQDMGLLECGLPPLPLIASTQMHNNTPGKVRFLEKTGFSRVILARELNLDEIRKIRARTSVELEVFVHGALCVCYSGQCLMSYAIGGRSGNRGACGQPCRRPYSLENGRGELICREKHLFSLKDMNRSDFLPDLLDAGVTAFKIEGRLKDKNYVTNLVSHYRNLLDPLLASRGMKKSSSGSILLHFKPDPGRTFNRGFTDYFLSGRKAGMASLLSPKSLGIKLGKILKTGPQGFRLDRDADLQAGDGICFFNSEQALTGTRIRHVSDGFACPDSMKGLSPGVTIHRNHDRALLKKLSGHPAERKISVIFMVSENKGGILFSARDEEGYEASLPLDIPKRPAADPGLMEKTYCRQLQKTGDTEFKCTDVVIRLSEPWFVPVSLLNRMRRAVLEALRAARSGEFSRTPVRRIPERLAYPEKSMDYRGNVLNRQAAAFYRKHGVAFIQPAAESGVDMNGKKIMSTRYCILEELGFCLNGKRSPSVSGPLFLKDREGRKYELEFRCGDCGMEVYCGFRNSRNPEKS
ncbi:U32 family peptidase [bacterium]|nr:U32 family peptidase [bacterium]